MDVALPQLVFAVQGAEALQFFVEGGRVLRCGGIGRAVGEIDLQCAAALWADLAPAQQGNPLPLVQSPEGLAGNLAHHALGDRAGAGDKKRAALRGAGCRVTGEGIGPHFREFRGKARKKRALGTFAKEEKRMRFHG